MGYSNYKKIRAVIKKFQLDLFMADLFPDVAPSEPSSWLQITLQKANIMVLTNEKTKAERIISPILVEVAEQYRNKISLFSGENLEVRPADDLAGECDFFFSLQPPKPFIDAPIITLVEAKDEDMEQGIAQCAAQMYGAWLFNEAEGKVIPKLYGCVTTGTDWQFISFENSTYYLDNKLYTDLRQILGVWKSIMDEYV